MRFKSTTNYPTSISYLASSASQTRFVSVRAQKHPPFCAAKCHPSSAIWAPSIVPHMDQHPDHMALERTNPSKRGLDEKNCCSSPWKEIVANVPFHIFKKGDVHPKEDGNSSKDSSRTGRYCQIYMFWRMFMDDSLFGLELSRS